jgi:hypothetical protein
VDLSAYASSKIRVRFRVSAYYYYGDYGTWQIDEVSVAEAPEDVVVQPPDQIGKHGMRVSWSASTEPTFVRYEVRRDVASVEISDALAASITDVGTTSFVDAGLGLNTTYHYKVFVVRQEGTEEVASVGSNEVSTTTLHGPTIPMAEDMEGSLENWDLGPAWGTTSDQAYSGVLSLTDSPGVPYAANADVSLTTSLTFLTAVQPYLSFWERHSFGANSHGFVEVSTDGTSWTRLADVTGFSPVWKQVRIDLSAYQFAPSVWVRFRMWGGGTQGEGWYIDDVRIEENTAGDEPYPFYDGMEDSVVTTGLWHSSSWELDGPGALGGGMWSGTADGRRGMSDALRYVTPCMSLAGTIDLTSAVAPQLVFWHQTPWWGTGNSQPGAFVDIQPEGGTWTQVWSTGAPPSTWTRIQVDLSAYASSKIRVRFRVSAYYYYGDYGTGGSVGVCVIEDPGPVPRERVLLLR